MSEKKIVDLAVYASGIYPVELSRGKRIRVAQRVKLKASVDCDTGKVTFYVNKDDIEKLEK